MPPPPVRGRAWRAAAGARIARSRWQMGVVGGGATLLASLAIRPLLDGAWWMGHATLLVAAIVLTGMATRTLRLPAPLQPVLQAVTLVTGLVVLFARDGATWGFLPGPTALEGLRDLAAAGREYARATVPPAGADAGLLLLLVAGVGLVALVVDTLAADLDLPGPTLIPLGALFGVPWVVGRGHAPTWTFVVVAFAWLAILAQAQRERAAQWAPGARPGTSGLTVAGIAVLVAALAGGAAAARMPFSDLSLGTGLGTGDGLRLDALVSLRRSLVSHDDRVVLRMTTTAAPADYLRLAVLEQFDGEQWSATPNRSFGPQPPPGAGGTTSEGQSLANYRIDVGPLVGAALPSPAGTIASLGEGAVAWDQATALPVRADGRSVQDSRIELVVAPTATDAEALRTASLLPGGAGVAAADLADPTPLVGDELPELARRITQGMLTPFDAAVALQRWFTVSGGFRYSTQIQGGSDSDALAAFLDERVGYCEQYAATMALMARAVGIPARVVVGFTQGRKAGEEWVVRGTDAHAWPELWMGSAGWVRFEPTPGAATTTVPRYTFPEVDGSASPSAADRSAPAAGSSRGPDRLDESLGASAAGGTGRGGLPPVLLAAVLAVAVLLIPAATRVARRLRRRRIGDGESTFREVSDTLVDLRLGKPGPTPRMTMSAVTTALGRRAGDPDLADAIASILRAVEWQRYGGHGAGPADPPPGGAPAGLAHSGRAVGRALAERVGWGRRIRAALLPRSVIADALARFSGSSEWEDLVGAEVAADSERGSETAPTR